MPHGLGAKVVVLHALGWEVSKTVEYLRQTATPVSRSTVFRCLSAIDDARLRQVHLANRRATKEQGTLRRVTAPKFGRFWTGSWETGYIGELAAAVEAAPVVWPAGQEVKHMVTRWTAMVIPSYGSIARLEAMLWIREFLNSNGGAEWGFRSRRELERMFPPDDPPYLIAK